MQLPESTARADYRVTEVPDSSSLKDVPNLILSRVNFPLQERRVKRNEQLVTIFFDAPEEQEEAKEKK